MVTSDAYPPWPAGPPSSSASSSLQLGFLCRRVHDRVGCGRRPSTPAPRLVLVTDKGGGAQRLGHANRHELVTKAASVPRGRLHGCHAPVEGQGLHERELREGPLRRERCMVLRNSRHSSPVTVLGAM